MGNQDLKPTRLHCTLKLLESFKDEYFYLNPISQVRQLVLVSGTFSSSRSLSHISLTSTACF